VKVGVIVPVMMSSGVTLVMVIDSVSVAVGATVIELDSDSVAVLLTDCVDVPVQHERLAVISDDAVADAVSVVEIVVLLDGE